MDKMFTEEDFQSYFNEMEDSFKKVLLIYTDLLNLMDDRSSRSKIQAVSVEDMDAFTVIQTAKEKFAS